MERGRQRWQTLEQLGRQVRDTTPAAGAAGNDATHDAPQSSAAAAGSEPLDQAWARFETEQELEALRRRQGQGR
jgi:hypothetical protein